jgi:RimJ/RimL family protein N-acetyltransferase
MMHGTVVLRPATIDDAPRIVAHLARVAASDAFFRLPPEALTVEHEEAFIRAVRPEAYLYLLAVDGDDVVGTLYLATGDAPEIRHVASLAIALSPEARGRGVATRMMAEAILWAKDHGIKKIILNVISLNEPALRLYRRFGFVEEGRRQRMFRLGDRYADEVLLSLDL